MRWIVKALKYIATHPWVWALGEQVNNYVIKPIIKKIKKK